MIVGLNSFPFPSFLSLSSPAERASVCGHCERAQVMERVQSHLELGPSTGSAHGVQGGELETRPGCTAPSCANTLLLAPPPREHCL